MATHSNILGGEFHGQRSLADYSPWGSKESDMITNSHTEFLRLCAELAENWILVQLGIYDQGKEVYFEVPENIDYFSIFFFFCSCKVLRGFVLN